MIRSIRARRVIRGLRMRAPGLSAPQGVMGMMRHAAGLKRPSLEGHPSTFFFSARRS